MSRSVTNPIKSFIPQRTGTRHPSSGNRDILKSKYDSSTKSASVYLLAEWLPVPDTDWFLYDEEDYIKHMDALDIHSVYTDKINKVVSNTMDSRHYYKSNRCSMCGYASHTFDECELLKKHDLLKIQCIIF